MLGPKKIFLKEIIIDSLGAFIAGIIGSILIFVLVFLFSGIIDVSAGFNSMKIGAKTTAIFPLFLSVIALVATFITMFLTYYILTLTQPDKYRKNIFIYGQLAIFTVIVYIFISPVYIYEGLKNYEFIVYIFLFHILILAFGMSLIIELLNNYSYVLAGLYGSFIGLFISSIISIYIFSSFSDGYAKLISIVAMLPIINFLMTFFKQLFEFSYFYYYRYTALDPIGDIFRTIENEELEIAKEEEEKNMI